MPHKRKFSVHLLVENKINHILV